MSLMVNLPLGPAFGASVAAKPNSEQPRSGSTKNGARASTRWA